MKTIKYNKDKTVELKRYFDKDTWAKESIILTRIVDLKGGNWRDYPTYYKIGDYYYV